MNAAVVPGAASVAAVQGWAPGGTCVMRPLAKQIMCRPVPVLRLPSQIPQACNPIYRASLSAANIKNPATKRQSRRRCRRRSKRAAGGCSVEEIAGLQVRVTIVCVAGHPAAGRLLIGVRRDLCPDDLRRCARRSLPGARQANPSLGRGRDLAHRLVTTGSSVVQRRATGIARSAASAMPNEKTSSVLAAMRRVSVLDIVVSLFEPWLVFAFDAVSQEHVIGFKIKQDAG
jgi:hypothetical protein